MSQINLTPEQAEEYNRPENLALRDAFECLSTAGFPSPARNVDYWEKEARTFDLNNAHRYFDYMKV